MLVYYATKNQRTVQSEPSPRRRFMVGLFAKSHGVVIDRRLLEVEDDDAK